MLDKKHLQNKTVCLDLSNSIAYKKKKSLIDLIALHGLKVSFIINKSASILIRDDRDNLDTYKCRTAFKLGVPIIHVDYIYEMLLNGNHNVKLANYLIKNKKDETDFKNGLVSVAPNSKFIFSTNSFLNSNLISKLFFQNKLLHSKKKLTRASSS